MKLKWICFFVFFSFLMSLSFGCSTTREVVPKSVVLLPPKVDRELLRDLETPKQINNNSSLKEKGNVMSYNNLLWAKERIYLRALQDYVKETERLALEFGD